MNLETFEALFAIVKIFGIFAIACAIGYAIYVPIFNYMVTYHRKFMEKVIPDYFEKKPY